MLQEAAEAGAGAAAGADRGQWTSHRPVLQGHTGGGHHCSRQSGWVDRRYLGVQLTIPCTAELWPHLAATLAPPGEDKLLARLEVRGAALAATDVPHLARCVRAGDSSENIFM